MSIGTLAQTVAKAMEFKGKVVVSLEKRIEGKGRVMVSRRSIKSYDNLLTSLSPFFSPYV